MCFSRVVVSAVFVRSMFLVFLLLFVPTVGSVVTAPTLGLAFATAAAAVALRLLPLPLPLLLHFLLLEDKHKRRETVLCGNKKETEL